MIDFSRYAVCLAVVALGTGCMAETADTAETAESDIGTISEAVVTPNFSVGLQLTDHGTNTAYAGDFANTIDWETSGSESPWACDNNCWQPDSARVELDSFTNNLITGWDFRICMIGSDGKSAHTEVGIWKCTGWASAGGGWTGMATDANAHDPDSYKVRIDSRPWPKANENRMADFRLRIRGYDGGTAGAWSAYTGWASQGGGVSGWGCDSNCFDPDGFEIELNVLMR
jgi:hypothetical protein